VLRLNH